MPLWLIIMVAGAAGTGFLFLKARRMESKNTLKKVKAGHRSVKRAAKAVAEKPSTVEVHKTPTSSAEINMSQDLASGVARDLEEVLEKEGL